MTTTSKNALISNRNALFDNFRGILIFVFVMLAVLGGIYRYNDAANLPAWVFDHARGLPIGIGGSPFTPVDLGMIFFYFIGAMVAVPSYKKRMVRDGKGSARSHLFTRNIGLIGIGAVMYLIAGIASQSETPGAWGPLHSIGFTGLLTMLFLGLKPVWRAVSGAAFITLHDVFSQYVYKFLNTPNFSSDGGFAVCLMYAGFFLITTVLFDLYRINFILFLMGFLPILAVTITIYGTVPPTCYPYNFTFFAVTYCAVTILFIIYYLLHKGFAALFEKYVFKHSTSQMIPLIGRMGRNLLFYFVARYPIAALFQILYNAFLWRAGLVGAGIIVSVAAIGIFIGFEALFNKRNWVVKL
ncbi:MAG: hypothetical protein LBT55_07800 [Clostridiaceae bacterium]|jgi:hypothetical protein|nr:hypothetical protein [Clostridiaceae bacterium]